MKDHIILCGLGHIGYRITELMIRLCEKLVVITDKTREEWKEKVELSGIKVILGDASNDRKLVEAGIKTAKTIIAATDNDLINVTIALDAKRINPHINVVIRLFDQTLAKSFEQNLGARRVLSTSLISAPEFASASLGDNVLGSFEINDCLFKIERLKSGDESLIKIESPKHLWESKKIVVVGGSIRKNSAAPLLQNNDFMILNMSNKIFSLSRKKHQKERIKNNIPAAFKSFFKTITRSTWFIFIVLFFIVIISTALFWKILDLDPISAFYYVITTITTVGYGDINLLDAMPLTKLYGCFLMLCGAAFMTALFGTVTNFFIQERLELFFGKHSAAQSGHIVVSGCGNLSYRVVTELLRAGQDVLLIAQEEKDESVKAIRELCPVIFASLRSKDGLVKANYSKARGLVALWDDDMINLSLGAAAKEINPRARVILRAFYSDFAIKARGMLKIDSIISMSLIAAPSFVGAALYPDVMNAVVAGDKFYLFHHTFMTDDSKWLNLPLEKIEKEENITILLVKKSGDGFNLPDKDKPIQKNEEMIYLRAINIKNEAIN